MSIKNRTIFFLLIAVLVITRLVAITQATMAGASAQLDPLAALPESDVVMVIDAQRILNEVVPRILANDPAMLKQMNASLDELKVTTGIDARRVGRVVIGMRGLDLKAITEQGRFPGVIIAQGFDADKMLALLQLAMPNKYRQEQHGGKTIHTFALENQTKPSEPQTVKIREMSITALDASTLALGDLPHVQASIDASAGSGARVSGDLIALATRNPNALVSIAGNLPPELAQQAFATVKEPLPVSEEFIKAVSSIKQFFGTIGDTPNGYDFSMGARASSEAEAKTLSDTLAAFKALGVMSMLKEENKTFQDLIKSIQISSTGDSMEIKAEVTQATINALMKSAPQLRRAPASKGKTRARGRLRQSARRTARR